VVLSGRSSRHARCRGRKRDRPAQGPAEEGDAGRVQVGPGPGVLQGGGGVQAEAGLMHRRGEEKE